MPLSVREEYFGEKSSYGHQKAEAGKIVVNLLKKPILQSVLTYLAAIVSVKGNVAGLFEPTDRMKITVGDYMSSFAGGGRSP